MAVKPPSGSGRSTTLKCPRDFFIKTHVIRKRPNWSTLVSMTAKRSIILGKHFRCELALRTHKACGEILRKERVGFCASDGFLGVLLMFVCRAGESDQRGGKFHLRVVSILGGAAQGERLLDQGIAIEARGGILFLLRNTHPRLTDPLFVSFREIAGVKPGQGIRVA